jgi:transcriptional regulator with XRE-family HTH domain
MDLGERLQTVRKRRGLTQRELAESSGVSLSPEPAPPHGNGGGELWTPTREALASMRDAPTAAEPVSVRSLEAALSHATRLYHDNEYERLARVLPRLIDDANSAPALLRSRTLQLAGSVMVQTRQPDSARIALNQSLTDAESTGNVLDAASAVITLCWLLIVERQFEAVRHLATRWADRVEPRLSVATTRELSTWGWLLLRASAAAVRDNRPDEADEMMRLAAAGAVAVRPESGPYHQYWTTFDPATVAMKRVENAVVDDRPDVALRLARDIPPDQRPTSDNRNRHLIDVSAAHVELRHYDAAFDVLAALSRDARPWLVEQRSVRDLLARIISKRRTLTPEMRELADLVQLEY